MRKKNCLCGPAVDLWRCLLYSRRRWQRRRFCHHWKFAVQTESYGYASLPTDPRDADAAITGSQFASLGDAPFYRGSVNTGDSDTDLIFASDGQLELLRSCRLVYVDATFQWGGGALVIWSAIYILRSEHGSLVTGAVRSHYSENNCNVSRRLWKAACITGNTTIN